MNNMSNKSLVSSGMVLTTSSGSVYTITDRVAKNGRKYQLISGGNLEQDNLVIYPVNGAMIGQPFQCRFMDVESNGPYANQTLTTSRIASARAVRPTNGLSVARPMEQVDMKRPKPRFKGADVAYSQPQRPRPIKSVPEMIAERPNYNQGAMRATQDILNQKSDIHYQAERQQQRLEPVQSVRKPREAQSPFDPNNAIYKNISPYMAPEVVQDIMAGNLELYDALAQAHQREQENPTPQPVDRTYPNPASIPQHIDRPRPNPVPNPNRIYGQGNPNQRIRKEERVPVVPESWGGAFPGYNPADFPNQEIENTAQQQVVTVNTQNDTYSFRENWDKNGMSYFECRCRKFGDNVHYVKGFNPDKIQCGEPLVIRFLNVPENGGYHGRGILTTEVQSVNVKSVPRQFFDTRTLPSIDRSEEEMDRYDEMNHYNGL